MRQDGKRPTQGTRQEERRRKGSLKNEGEEQNESNEHGKEEEMKEDGKDEKGKDLTPKEHPKDETHKEHPKDFTRKPLPPAPAHNVTRPQLVEPASDHASRAPSQKPARQRSPEGSPGARHGAASSAPIGKLAPASKSPFLQPRTAQSDGSDSDPQLASVDDKPGTRKRVVRIGQTKRPHVNGPHTPQVHGVGRGVRERGMGSIQRVLRQRVAASIASAAEAVRQEELQVSKMLLQVEVSHVAQVLRSRRPFQEHRHKQHKQHARVHSFTCSLALIFANICLA